MFCHNGIPQIPAGNEAPDSDPVFTGDLPEGIDCQRCHGPGGDHIRTVRNRASKPADVRASIVNPARLSAAAPHGNLHAMPPRDLQRTDSRVDCALQPRPFFVPAGRAAGRLPAHLRPCARHRPRRQIRSRQFGVPAAEIALFPRKPGQADLRHLPQPAPGAARGRSRGALFRRLPQCHAAAARSADRRRPAHEVRRLHRLPHAQAKGGGHAGDGHDRPSDSAPPAPGKPAGGIPRAPARGVPRRGRALLSVAPAAHAGERALSWRWRRSDWATMRRPACPSWRARSPRRSPREAEFYKVLGDAWLNAGKPREAVAAYEQALQLNPKSVTALRSLASALSADGQSARAAEILQRALRIAPADPITWYRYGMLDFASGNTLRRVEKIRKAIELDPSLPDQSRSLAEVLAKAGQPDLARAALRDALRTDPYDDAAWDLAGRVLTEKGEMPEAFFDFEKAGPPSSRLWTVSLRLCPGAGPCRPLRRGAGTRRSRPAGRSESGGRPRTAGRPVRQKAAVARSRARVPADPRIAARFEPRASAPGERPGRTGRRSRRRRTPARSRQKQRRRRLPNRPRRRCGRSGPARCADRGLPRASVRSSPQPALLACACPPAGRYPRHPLHRHCGAERPDSSQHVRRQGQEGIPAGEHRNRRRDLRLQRRRRQRHLHRQRNRLPARRARRLTRSSTATTARATSPKSASRPASPAPAGHRPPA